MLFVNTMDESTLQSTQLQVENVVLHYQIDNSANVASFEILYEVKGNTKDMTPEHRQARFMTAFALCVLARKAHHLDSSLETQSLSSCSFDMRDINPCYLVFFQAAMPLLRTSYGAA